ncbi:MAG TPA: protein kinase [Gemmataceae bacterium]|nr:protein kinase [Gemmataceae bacterium]
MADSPSEQTLPQETPPVPPMNQSSGQTPKLNSAALPSANSAESPESAIERMVLGPTPTPVIGSGEELAGTVAQSAAEQVRASALSNQLVDIPGYRVLEKLGEGGMKVVFLAQNNNLPRLEAIALLKGQFLSEAERDRFRAEAHAISHFQHVNIVQIFAIGECQSASYFAMEYCDQGSLHGRLDGTPLKPRDAAALVETIARAMHAAHQRQIIHRDLKPANILLSTGHDAKPGATTDKSAFAINSLIPKVSDFGLAKKLDTDSKVTMSGVFMGTPSYTSPEQAAGKIKELGAATDIYALGSILYECLTGRPPFKAASAPETLVQVLNQEPVPPTRLNPATPRDLETICLKCLQKDIARRYGSAAELADDLRRWQNGESILARPAGTIERTVKWAKRRPAVAGLLGAVGLMILVSLVLGGIAIYLLNTNLKAEKQKQADDRKYVLVGQIVDLTYEDWSPAQVRSIRDMLKELEQIDPDLAAKRREQVETDFGLYFAKVVYDPTVDEKTMEDLLAATADAFPERAAEWQSTYKRRTAPWRPIPELQLKPQFANVGDAFGDGQVAADNAGRANFRPDARFLIRAKADVGPFILTKVRSSSRVMMHANFEPSWSKAPAVGLTLNDSGSHRYLFLLSVPEFEPEKPLRRFTSMNSAIQTGDPLRLRIIRDGAILRDLRWPVPNVDILQLNVERQEDNLAMIVAVGSTNATLEFIDPFPLAANSGHFGLIWPGGVGIELLTGHRRNMPELPSPLEKGDEYFSQGDYVKAQAEYEFQVSRSGPGPIQQAARYKNALCLRNLQRNPKALAIWNKLLQELPVAVDPQTARWSLLAAAQLWKWHLQEGQTEEAFAVLKNVPPSKFGFAELCRLIPAEERAELLDQLTMRGSRGVLAYKPLAFPISRFESALVVAEQLQESSYERRVSKWRLADAYRVHGQKGAAMNILVQLLAERDLPVDELVAYTRDLVWLEIGETQAPSEGELKDAMARIDHVLASSENSPAFLPLLIEKARVHRAMGDIPAAEKDIDQFFASEDRKERFVNYTDYSDACLVKGFLRWEQGDKDGAQAAWKKGLISQWQGVAIPLPPPGRRISGPAMDARQNAMTHAVMLGSLTGQISEKEAVDVFKAATTGTGITDRFFQDFAKDMLPPKYLQAICLEAYRSDRGREWAKRWAYRQGGFKALFGDAVHVFFYEAIRLGCWEGRPVPKELDEILNKGVDDLFRLFEEGKIREDNEAVAILRIWRAELDDPRADWTSIAATMEPDLRNPMAFAFGMRYVQMKKPYAGRPLLKEIMDREKPGTFLHKLAKEELEKIKPNAGKP